MTTIAYRDGILACDSGMVLGEVLVGKTQKAWAYKGHIVTGCGDASDIFAFRDWFVRGMKGDCPDPNGDGFLILITPEGLVMEREKYGWVKKDCPFYAWGSGFEIALGALAHGASAREAVEIACEYDIYSQEPVMQFVQERG